MYWKDKNLYEWVIHINSIVGDDSDKGGFLIGEKTDHVEVSMDGEKDELLQILAISVYYFSKKHEMSFEDALTAISDMWSEMRKEKGYLEVGDEIVDLETGIGINKETERVSFPIPPMEVQEQIMQWIEESSSKTDEVKKHLHSVEDIKQFFEMCSSVAGFIRDEETGEKGITFVYHDDRFFYYPEQSGLISHQTDTGIGIDIFEDDEMFHEIVVKLLEQGIYH